MRVLINLQRGQWRMAKLRRQAPVSEQSLGTGSATQENACVAGIAVWAALDRLQPRRHPPRDPGCECLRGCVSALDERHYRVLASLARPT